MASRSDFLLSAMLGVMAAGRSQSIVAFLAWNDLAPKVGTPLGRGAATLSAVGEAVVDKTPLVPDRTEPGPLFGRAMFGAVGAAAVARHQRAPIVPAALVGGAAAIAGTFALHRARRWLGQRTPLPDLAWALAEDASVAAMAVTAARRVNGH